MLNRDSNAGSPGLSWPLPPGAALPRHARRLARGLLCGYAGVVAGTGGRGLAAGCGAAAVHGGLLPCKCSCKCPPRL
eukprot:914136-Alexandrium_andersonii.AAC.1